MRSIKFRVWLKNAKVMEYPEKLRHLFMWIEDENQPIEIMQYTGLKDKNGKEIYEGDILQKNCLPKKGYVKFADGCFFIQYEHDSNFIASRNAFEIIGNIYESPELLNK